MSIKILIADDHALLRQGIKRVLNFEDDLEVVGEASEGQEALSRTLVLQPDVLLIDLNMPGLSGIEVTKQLVAARVKTRIIALTVHDSDRYVLEMLRNGALGYILKDVEPTMLIKAIHVVANGGTFVYPKLAERIFGGLSDGADVKAKAREMWRDGRGDRLTAREMDVLACIAKGFSNQDIAKALFVSEKTVKNHLTNIFRKLNVNDRTQALIYVLKHKIVSLE
ncbi:MAG: response regulator transcription factor [Schwartzia sp.]|jgi:DNA-binding NarL/FixJ family response regulator|nr:response regulator transcription factor [Schwartzia succinivorans]MBP5201063.1 response regulator transcription factor [Schwartzia sp. (in: firmicutes)]